jgi:hypothetical protein
MSLEKPLPMRMDPQIHDHGFYHFLPCGFNRLSWPISSLGVRESVTSDVVRFGHNLVEMLLFMGWWHMVGLFRRHANPLVL